MARKSSKPSITSVMYTYVGNDAQFNEFLKRVIRDYFEADNPYTNPPSDFIDKVESSAA